MQPKNLSSCIFLTTFCTFQYFFKLFLSLTEFKNFFSTS